MDDLILDLERRVAEFPDDRAARRWWRHALVRAGRAAEAGLELGDLVRVTERADLLLLSFYTPDPWRATLLRCTFSDREAGSAWQATLEDDGFGPNHRHVDPGKNACSNHRTSASRPCNAARGDRVWIATCDRVELLVPNHVDVDRPTTMTI